jgi:hypothetical protein
MLMTRTNLNLLVFSFVVLVAASTAYAYVSTGTTRVTRIGVYAEYGGGDVVFSVANPLPGCEGGFWLKKSDPGFQTTLSTLLSAYHARATVKVYALTDQIWPGSAAPHCRLYAFELL